MENLTEIEKMIFAAAFSRLILRKYEPRDAMYYAIKAVKSYRYILPLTYEYDKL